MFNLIVSGGDLAWEHEGTMTTPTERFKEHTGQEGAAISLDQPETYAALEAAETLLMYEFGTSGPNKDVVRVGHVYDIRAGRKEISFRFRETGRVPREVIYKFGDLLHLEDWEKNRNHWAIKDGKIHSLVKEKIVPTRIRYDVALSFAGNDREYVDRVANDLAEQGVAVFYDKFEEVELWGKDLVEHLDAVYRTGAKFCVMFISKHYGERLWTNHERKSALAAAFASRQEYILPVRFDDTELPGLRPTIGYLDLKDRSPKELAKSIMEKLRR